MAERKQLKTVKNMKNLAEELRNLTEVNYCEDREHWYWEDFKNDTYRQGFESRELAEEDLKEWLKQNS